MSSTGNAEPLDDPPAVMRTYTPALLAAVVEVPVAVIRRWHRRGLLQHAHLVRRLPHFDFTELAIARHLAQLVHAGCSLQVIERQLAELARRFPELPRPLADPAVVVQGRQLYLRREADLAEPSGQLLIDFEAVGDPTSSTIDSVATISFVEAAGQLPLQVDQYLPGLPEDADLLQTALDWEDAGDLPRAAEAYRTLLAVQGPSADTNLALADVLYRLGELTAARERLYVAVELDEQYVEARATLGCVLAENGELVLATAAFEGALHLHPDFADVHFQLAEVLDRQGRRQEAQMHWHRFLELVPESPWAATARERLGD